MTMTKHDKSFVFIAGPYRARSGAHDHSAYVEIDTNINEAREWAGNLTKYGIHFFCPHMNSAHFEVITPDAPPEFWYTLDLAILEHAAAILMLPRWQESSGVKKELERAKQLGKPVFYAAEGLETLIQWWDAL